MKAVIKLDVPEWQIGQEVNIFFPDSMHKTAKCEAEKIRQRPERLLPCCRCGCKKRTHWYGPKNSEEHDILECCRCGLTVRGRNEIEVHKNWNNKIKALMKQNGESENEPKCKS